MVAAYVDSRQRGPAFVCVAAFVVLVAVVTSAVAFATATLAAVGTSPENTAGGHDYDSPSTIAVATTPAVTDVASRGFPAATGTTGFTYDSPLYSYATNTADGLLGMSYGRTGTVVANPELTIKGFEGSAQPGHAINQIINRGGGKPDVLLDTMRNPRVVQQQVGERYLYLTDEAAGVIRGDGQVVTAWTRSEFLPHVEQILRDAGGLP